MRVAVAGCVHGALDSLFATVKSASSSRKVDVLLCCGDFQAMRNLTDLHCMTVPDKYKSMGSFHKYYSGQKVAPVLTLFIGGNHEASNYLQELPYGGWVAPNIYFMGYAATVVVSKRCGDGKVERLRVSGLSGIYKGRDVLRGHFERPPYDDDALRSVYHVRNVDAFRLTQLRDSPPHVVLSHDWPRGVEWFGDTQQLLRRKPHFQDDVHNGVLGSRPAEDVLRALKPKYWFSAHLHVKFAAVVTHLPDESGVERKTKFLALDKCLPKRGFLQVLDIEGDVNKEGEKNDKVSESNSKLGSTSTEVIGGSIWLEHDKAWLSVLRSTEHLFSVSRTNMHMPGPGYEGRWDFKPDAEDLYDIQSRLQANLVIDAASFQQTAKPFDGETESENMLGVVERPASLRRNRQTIDFCKRLGIANPCEAVGAYANDEEDLFSPSLTVTPSAKGILPLTNTSKIRLEDDDDDDNCNETNKPSSSSSSSHPKLSLPVPSLSIGNSEDAGQEGGFVIDTRPTSLKVQCESNQRPALKRRNHAIYQQDDD